MRRRAGFTSASLVAAFTVGEALLYVGKGGLLSVAFAVIGALVLLPLAEMATRSVYDGKIGAVRRALLALTIVASTATASSTASAFSRFVSLSMLSGVPTLAIRIAFLFLAASLALQGERSVKKFALVAFVITAAVAVMLFLLSAESLDVARIDALFKGGLSFSGVMGALGRVVAPSILALIFLSLEKGEGCGGGVFLAVIFSSAILLLCRLNVSLLLGESLAASLEYPYSEAVSTVTAGKLFARLEGWAYLMYYAAAACRTSVCLSLSCRLFYKIFPSWERKKLLVTLLPFAFGVLSLVGVTNLFPHS